MPRLKRNRSRRGDIILYSDAVDTGRDLPLRLDVKRKGFKISGGRVPFEVGSAGSLSVAEWAWQNGPDGAGTTVETTESYAGGASEYGEFCWLRRLGVAQPAGRMVEVSLPSTTAALTSGRFTQGLLSQGDLFITTRNRTVVRLDYALGTGVALEHDLGAGAETTGIVHFDGAGGNAIYVGDPNNGIWEFDNGVWTEGASGTEREWLAVPYWNLGPKLATGGLDGTAGDADFRLVGTNADGSGFYVVAGDPKVSANWNSLTVVGGDSTLWPINSIVQDNRTVWFGTGGGVKGADALGHTPTLTQWVKESAWLDNCKAIAFWNDLIWFGHEQGLCAFAPDGSRVDFGTFLQFGARSGGLPIFGRPRALATSPEGMYVAYYNHLTETSYIGILLYSATGGYRWSMAECVIPDQEVTYLQQVADGNGAPKLYIGTIDGDGALHLYFQELPRSGDPEADVDAGNPYFTPATNWSLRLSRFNRDGVPLTFRRWQVEADHLGAGFPDNTIDVQVSADGGAFASQGTATDSPRWTSIPTSAYIRATNAQIKLDVHNAPDAPVVVRSVAALYSPRPERTKVWRYPIVIGEGVTGQDPKVILNRLERSMRADPITCVDHLGRTVVWLIEDVDEIHEPQDGAEAGDWTIHADLTVSVVRDPTRYDVGDAFDTGQAFS